MIAFGIWDYTLFQFFLTSRERELERVFIDLQIIFIYNFFFCFQAVGAAGDSGGSVESKEEALEAERMRLEAVRHYF